MMGCCVLAATTLGLKGVETKKSCRHNREHECFDCTTARHAAEHAEYVDDCRLCKFGTLRIYGRFTGTASLSDAVQTFWSTGDPAVFDAQDRQAAGARAERATKLDRRP